MGWSKGFQIHSLRVQTPLNKIFLTYYTGNLYQKSTYFRKWTSGPKIFRGTTFLKFNEWTASGFETQQKLCFFYILYLFGPILKFASQDGYTFQPRRNHLLPYVGGVPN